MNPKVDLSGLRDLHLISRPPVWPLAMGWWILLISLFVLIVVSVFLYNHWYQKPAVYAVRKARKMSHDISDDIEYLKNISQLLKRVGIAVYGREQIAPLSDTTWQTFLLKQAPETLSKKEAHLIAFAPYEEKLKSPISRTLLTEHIELWIKKVFKNKKSS